MLMSYVRFFLYFVQDLLIQLSENSKYFVDWLGEMEVVF